MQSPEPGGDSSQALCNCPKIMRPVCLANGTFVANNWCIAVKCKQAVSGTVAHKHCKPPHSTHSAEQQAGEVEQQQQQQELQEKTEMQEVVEEPVQQTCKCPKILRPVCLGDGEEVAANECIANKCLKIESDKLIECWRLKEGLRDSKITGDEAEEEGEDEEGKEDEGWVCTAEFDPVCFKNGTMAGSNPCFASHNPAAKREEYKSEWCLPEERTVVRGPAPEEERPIIVCTAEFNPQCAEDGAPVGSNPCKAAQNKKYEGVPYSSEWCKHSAAVRKPLILGFGKHSRSSRVP